MTQDKVLAAIRRFWKEHGYSPSIEDLVREVPLSSTSVAAYHLNKLEEAGQIERTPGVARSIVLPPNRVLVEVDGVVTGIWAERLDVVVTVLYPRCEALQNVWRADGDDELFKIKSLGSIADITWLEEVGESHD